MRRLALLASAVALAVVLGCDSDGDSDADADSDADVAMDAESDGDADSGADGDGDSDADADSDVDADADGDADADAPPDGGHLGECSSGPDCIDERDELAELLAADRATACAEVPLTRDPRLDLVAQERATACADYQDWRPPGLIELREHLRANIEEMLGVDWRGEANYMQARTVEAIETRIWEYEDEEGALPMRDRISDCLLDMVGIGIAADETGSMWAVQVFLCIGSDCNP